MIAKASGMQEKGTQAELRVGIILTMRAGRGRSGMIRLWGR